MFLLRRITPIWFHEVFRNGGTPYMVEEVEFIRRMTGKTEARAAGKS